MSFSCQPASAGPVDHSGNPWRRINSPNRLCTFITFLFVIVWPLPGQAQEPSQAGSNLDTLVAIALRNNPEVALAQYEMLAAEQRIAPASSLPDPQLNIGAMNVPTNFSLTSDMMTMAPRVGVMQMFPWFGKLSAAGDIQRYNHQSAEEALVSNRLNIIMNLKMVYGETYRTEKTIGYLEYKRRLLESVVKVAEQLFAVGLVPQQDVFRATAELTMVQSDLLTEQSMLANVLARLGALLGQSLPREIRVDTLDIASIDSLPVLRDLLAASNPDLKQLRSAELSARTGAVLARKEAVPDLSVGVSYGYRGALMPDGRKALNMVNLEVGINLPVFFGSKQQANIDEADLMDRAAEERLRAASLALDSQLNSLVAEADAQNRLIPLYSRELIPQYEATYNSSLSAYSVGKTTFAMLIDNLTKLINAKIEFVKIQSAYFSTVAAISRLVGEGRTSHGDAQ